MAEAYGYIRVGMLHRQVPPSLVSPHNPQAPSPTCLAVLLAEGDLEEGLWLRTCWRVLGLLPLNHRHRVQVSLTIVCVSMFVGVCVCVWEVCVHVCVSECVCVCV